MVVGYILEYVLFEIEKVWFDLKLFIFLDILCLMGDYGYGYIIIY